uniref:Uncharacterized protein n=1 Tax=Neolamprologus brichardi TaxID=32507 RepID=A0A3Q4MXI8_NEOBR
ITSGVQELAEGLNSMTCRLKILRLQGCGLTAEICRYLSQCLISLLELNLSNNSLKDAGFKIICEGMYAWCSLQKLNVSRCGITGAGCRYLAKVLCSISQLTDGGMGVGEWQAVELIDLDLSMNHIGDKGVKEISPSLMNPLSHLKTLNLSYCSLTDSCCAELASGLMSKANILSKLDLSHNNLQDKGAKKLCIGLQSPHCKLEEVGVGGLGRPGWRSFSAQTLLPNGHTIIFISNIALPQLNSAV